ncbi:hypothetical protein F5051DRAFT_207572 [Lentinula edodes]|nr:hypothetical protein F5051DRAFT_207572 [Lentinula edodes]
MATAKLGGWFFSGVITHGSTILGFALTGIMTNVLLDAKFLPVVGNDSPTILTTAFVVRGFITGACFLPTWYSSEQVSRMTCIKF